MKIYYMCKQPDWMKTTWITTNMIREILTKMALIYLRAGMYVAAWEFIVLQFMAWITTVRRVCRLELNWIMARTILYWKMNVLLKTVRRFSINCKILPALFEERIIRPQFEINSFCSFFEYFIEYLIIFRRIHGFETNRIR